MVKKEIGQKGMKASQHRSILELEGAELARALDDISNKYRTGLWTDKKDEILKHLHGKIPTQEIARILGMPYGPVKYRIVTLQRNGALSKVIGKPWTWHSPKNSGQTSVKNHGIQDSRNQK